MSGSGVPKAILLIPPTPEEKTENNTLGAVRSARFYEVRTKVTQSLQDMHKNRVQGLRKNLDYLKETEWKYEPIDNYIGQ